MTLALAVPEEMSLGAAKFKMGHIFSLPEMVNKVEYITLSNHAPFKGDLSVIFWDLI